MKTLSLFVCPSTQKTETEKSALSNLAAVVLDYVSLAVRGLLDLGHGAQRCCQDQGPNYQTRAHTLEKERHIASDLPEAYTVVWAGLNWGLHLYDSKHSLHD